MLLLAETIAIDPAAGFGLGLGSGGLIMFWRLIVKLGDWLDDEKIRRKLDDKHREAEIEHWRREEMMLAQALGIPMTRDFGVTPRPVEVPQR